MYSNNKLTQYLFTLILLLMSGVVAAQEAVVGRVLLTAGQVTAIDPSGNTRNLERRANIYAQDTILTAASSKVQIRFIDNGLIALSENSQLNIRNYQQAKAETGEESKILMELIEGGFRSLTGSIGKGTPEAYKVLTPTATLGIRGTLYSIQIKGNELLAGVWQGGIRITLHNGNAFDLGLDASYRFGVFTAEKFTGLLEVPEGLEAADTDSALPQNNDDSSAAIEEDTEQQAEPKNNDSTDNSGAVTEEANQSTIENDQLATIENDQLATIENDQLATIENDQLAIAPLAQLDEKALQEHIDRLEAEVVTNMTDIPYYSSLNDIERSNLRLEFIKAVQQGQQTYALHNDQFYQGYVFDDSNGGRIFALIEETNGLQALRFKIIDPPSWSMKNNNEGFYHDYYGIWTDIQETDDVSNYAASNIYGVNNNGSTLLDPSYLFWISAPKVNLANGTYLFQQDTNIFISNYYRKSQGEISHFELNIASGEIKNGILNLFPYTKTSSSNSSFLPDIRIAFDGQLENGVLNFNLIDSPINKFTLGYGHEGELGTLDLENSSMKGLLTPDGAVSLVHVVGWDHEGNPYWLNQLIEYEQRELIDGFSPTLNKPYTELAPAYPYLDNSYGYNLIRSIESGYKVQFVESQGNTLALGSGYFAEQYGPGHVYYGISTIRAYIAFDTDTYNTYNSNIGNANPSIAYFKRGAGHLSSSDDLSLKPINDTDSSQAALSEYFDAQRVDYGYWGSGRYIVTTQGRNELAYSDNLFFINAKGIELSGASGNKTFNVALISNVGSNKDIKDASGSFNLDLDSGQITSNNLQLEYVNSTWNVSFNGQLADGHFQSEITSGELTGGEFQGGHIVGTVIGAKNDPQGAITAHMLQGIINGNSITVGGVLGWQAQ